MTDAPVPAGVSVPRRQLAAYSGVAIPFAGLALPLSIYLPPLYGEALGLGVGVVGTVFVLARLWDLATDLAVGWMIDRFPSRWGRRKHWVVLSLPILMLAVWRLYLPPEGAGALYLGWWLFVLYVGFTLLLVTHYAWGAELTPDARERARVYGWRDTALVFGILACVLGPAAAEQLAGWGLRAQVGLVGAGLLAALPIGVLALVTVLPDASDAVPTEGSLGRALSAARRDAAFRMPIVLDFLTGVAQGVVAAVFVFAASYAYGLPDLASLVLLANFVAAFAGLPLWVRLARARGPERAFEVALLWAAAAHFLFLFVPPERPVLLILAVLVSGAAFGPPLFLTRTLMAGAIDRTSADGQAPIVSMGFALMTMSNKLSGALAVGLAYGALALMGFAPEDTAPDGAARLALRLLFALAPAALYLAAYRVLRRRVSEPRRVPEP